MRRERIAIVGGGLVGLATALQLQRMAPDVAITIFEKESRVGEHQSTHNSGVLHAGLYYTPGSHKARLAVSGLRMMVQFCREHGIRHEQCGKIVLATEEEQIPRLQELERRGHANGLMGLRWLSAREIAEIEPHARGVAALHVPEEGIVDYRGVCDAMEREVLAGGGDIRTSCRVERIFRSLGGWIINDGDELFDFLISCAGLHSDRVAKAAGAPTTACIVPFRGEYYCLRESARRLVRNLIYPVPDPAFPFLGVHFTRMIQGGIEAGPNAVLALSREGYSWKAVRVGDCASAALFPGLWNFLRKYPGTSFAEVQRSLSKGLFTQALQRMVPELQEDDLEPGGAGVRAQAMEPDGSLVEDFKFSEGPSFLHVINAPSPAATASLAIGEEIAGRVCQQMGCPFPVPEKDKESANV